MNVLQKIGKLEAIALIVMVSMNQIFLNLSNIIIVNTGSSAWINVIVISTVSILFCLLIIKLFKPFPTHDIVDVSEYLGNKILKTIVGILYISFFIFISSVILRYLTNSLKLIYFEKSPLTFLLILFLIPVVFAVRLGIKPISRVNLMFIPIVLISMLIILFSTVGDFVPQRIFPILGFGANETFLIGLNNIFTFSAFAYLYFLIPLLKKPDDFKKVAISSIIVSAIYIFLSVICLIMMFPFISFTDEMLSIYLLTRLIEFGKFFQRVDAIFVLIWILSAFSFLAITIEFANRTLKKLINLKTHKEIAYSMCAIIFSLALSLANFSTIKLMQSEILRYFVIVLVFVISLIILILANLKLKKEKLT
ncbi:MAG: GerAB/ArcD/ProY family transporter [Clostridia bacterium]|nr:GerAB/ArcD/ProY family transporter [Clostridia bacterium]